MGSGIGSGLVLCFWLAVSVVGNPGERHFLLRFTECHRNVSRFSMHRQNGTE